MNKKAVRSDCGYISCSATFLFVNANRYYTTYATVYKKVYSIASVYIISSLAGWFESLMIADIIIRQVYHTVALF